MLRPFPRPSIRLALERRVGRARDTLADVVEAVGRVVRDLLGQRHARVPLLVVLGQVRQAVQLVEDGHHVARPVVVPVQRDRVRVREVVVVGVFDDDVAAAC